MKHDPNNMVKLMFEDTEFAINKYQTTFAEYDEFCEDTNRKKPDDSGFGRGNRPVINVSYNAAVDYCKWLSEKTGMEYRLPTSEEWEFACRAGSQGNYCFGNDDSKLPEYAWLFQNSDRKTHPVGELKPNNFGLYDTHGNVWEWTSSKIMRGGSWLSGRDRARADGRYGSHPSSRFAFIGFRVLCAAPKKKGLRDAHTRKCR